MEDQLWAQGVEDEEDEGITYVGLKEINGIFIRATIRYLSELSSKNLSSQLLVNEGILDPVAAQSISAHDEMIMIANYRSRIEEAARLLNSWVRKVRPGRMLGDSNLVILNDPDRPQNYTASFEMPIADSILPPGVTASMLSIMRDLGMNYRIDRIPKTMPPVLAQLNLKGLHYYLASDEEFSDQQSMEIVAFMDRVVRKEDFPEARCTSLDGAHAVDQIKNIFKACLPDNVINIG